MNANLTTGFVTGNASVGTDTIVGGVNAIRGSNFADTLTGSNNAANTSELFEGWGGDDLINGGGGFDVARYDFNNNRAPLTAGMSFNLASGIASGLDPNSNILYGNRHAAFDRRSSVERKWPTCSMRPASAVPARTPAAL